MISPKNLTSSIYHTIFVQLRDLLVQGGSQEHIAHGIGKFQLQLPGIDELVAIAELPGNTPSVLLEWARSALQTDTDVLTMAVEGSAYDQWRPESILPQISCPVLYRAIPNSMPCSPTSMLKLLSDYWLVLNTSSSRY